MTTLYENNEKNNDIETGTSPVHVVAQQIAVTIDYTHFKDIKHDNSVIRSILVKPPQSDNTKLQKIIIGYCQCCLIIFCFPIIFTDLFFGFNSDPVCINQTFSQIKITMADYLKVCGFYNLFMLGVTLLAFNLITQINETEVEFGILNMIGTISKCILTALNIIGSVMYWAYFDKKLCNDNTNNYINISLIIKLICVLLIWCMTIQNNKKTEN
jgi:hypothetical protein